MPTGATALARGARRPYLRRVVDIIDGYRALSGPQRSSLALGNFDGVHLGHQALLSGAVSSAGPDARSGAYTFDPHPAKLLAPEAAPRMITTRERKLELIAAAGIDLCVVEPFSRELSELSPEAFVDDILVDALGACHITVGYDFSFGKGRAGSVDLLREMSADRFGLTVIEPVTVGDEVVSSSAIRARLREGDVAGANQLLGRCFDVDGSVVEGAKRGREIGVPTANIQTRCELLPTAGIYAGRCRLLDEDQWFGAAISLGTNPTFVDSTVLSLEVHILDFDRDIYGRNLRTSFVQRLRGEEKYDDVDALIAQIQRDIDDTRAILRETI